jgi:hypothetical protein
MKKFSSVFFFAMGLLLLCLTIVLEHQLLVAGVCP